MITTLVHPRSKGTAFLLLDGPIDELQYSTPARTCVACVDPTSFHCYQVCIWTISVGRGQLHLIPKSGRRVDWVQHPTYNNVFCSWLVYEEETVIWFANKIFAMWNWALYRNWIPDDPQTIAFVIQLRLQTHDTHTQRHFLHLENFNDLSGADIYFSMIESISKTPNLFPNKTSRTGNNSKVTVNTNSHLTFHRQWGQNGPRGIG